MLVKISDPQLSEPSHEEEEHQLLHELTRIDQRLKSKKDIKAENDEWRQCTRKKEEETFHKKKWQHEKENTHLPIYNTNMEYFSEICTQDIDDDSLFDPQNNFLAPPKPLPHHEPTNNTQNNKNYLQKKEFNTGHEKQNQAHNSQSQKQFPSNSQFVKEMNYAYRKDTQDRTQATPKATLPPKNTKPFGTKKGSTLSSKSQERKSSTNLRRAQTTPEHLLNKIPSKDNYIMKQIIAEQRQSIEDDPNQFKFHTFEAYLENNITNQSSQRTNNKKPTKYRHQQQDKISMECTFKPNILKKSSQIAKNNKNVIERLSASGQPSKDIKKPYQPQSKPTLNRNRLQQLSQPRRLKTQGPETIEQVPSFRPSLSKKSLEQMSNCMFDVATRNQIWKKEKQEKIERMRQEEDKQRQKRQNCTYSPNLCQYKGQNAPNISRFGRQGISNYFERLSGFNKAASQTKLNECSKQNRQSYMNISKQGYNSKGVKKQKYEDAVRQLHSRIMSLKI